MTVLSTALLSSLLLSGSMMASADVSPVTNMTETLMSGSPPCKGGGWDNCAECANDQVKPWCGGTNFPWNEMSCSPFHYYPKSFNRNHGLDETCTQHDEPLFNTLTNDEKGWPNWGVRAWAANFKGGATPPAKNYNDEYFVFHGCDGAGIQGGDCAGDIKYFERFGPLYDDTSKGVSNGCVWSDSLQKYFYDDHYQTCFTKDQNTGQPLGLDEARNNGWWNDGNTEDGFQCQWEGTDSRAYCKFIHPGTQKVYDDYRGGFGSVSGPSKTFWSMANLPSALEQFQSKASKGWWNFNYDQIKNYYGGNHPFAGKDAWFSFALFQWRASDSNSGNNWLSYPSIRMNSKKMFVDNEPGGELGKGNEVGHPPEVEVYLAGLDKNGPTLYLERWRSQSDGNFPQSGPEYTNVAHYPVHWEDVENGNSFGVPW